MPHLVVVLPSYSVSAPLLARYGPRIPALEHRQLLSLLMLPRVPSSEIVFVTTARPTDRVLDYYLSFVPADRRRDVRSRLHVVEVPDPTPRSITAKLLDRPDLMARIRTMTWGRMAYIEPWNVTDLETEVARRLGLPLNGTRPALWPLGFKSNGRRLMRDAGIPLPLGREDVRSVADVIATAEEIRRQHVESAGVVVKLDNSGTGEGNRVIRFADAPTTSRLRAAVESLDAAYLSDLTAGAVVEELVTGDLVTSPSVQVDISPSRHVEVLSTHEQILGGPDGHEYVGCRFPSDPAYRTRLTAYGEGVGRLLADRGAMGRFCVDFLAVRASPSRWQVHGLEINLRRSGTSHPFSLLPSLVPGRYDEESGTWAAADGSRRCYRSTDNLAVPAWQGRSADDVIDAVRSAGLEFDTRSGTGTILHMLNGLDIDGRVGLTSIGRTPAEAERLHETASAAIAHPAVVTR